MEKIFEAKNERDAIELAIREFGVNEDYLEVEVLQRTKNRLFGRNESVTVKIGVLGLPKFSAGEGGDSSYTDEKPKVYDDEVEKQEASQEHQDKVCSIVTGLIEKLGIEVSCSFSLEDNFYMVTIDSAHEEDQNILIGKHGKNIEALQNICNSIIQTQMKDFKEQIVLDVSQYRKKRTEWLISIAQRKSESVLETGKPYLMDDLGPFDRKIIHKVIKEYNGLASRSQGDGYYRRLKIFIEEEK